MYDEYLIDALSEMSGLELYVLGGVDLEGLSEREVAEELTELRGEVFTRDRVHRIRLTAHGRLRRRIEARVAA